jgi:predicted transcriptional regulator
MPQPQSGLTASAIAVLEMIAAGSTYEQILAAFPDLTYLDIFNAAEQALAMACTVPRPPAMTLSQRRERHARAYEAWTDAECNTLRELVRSGATVAQIAGRLQRNRGAIRSRIVKLGIVDELIPKEQERLRRNIDQFGEESDELNPSSPTVDIRKAYPRAYEKWTSNEERQLRGFIDSRLTVAQIARRLQRQRSAIRARITALDLVGGLSPWEQSELHRISKLDAVPADPSVDSNEDQ